MYILLCIDVYTYITIYLYKHFCAFCLISYFLDKSKKQIILYKIVFFIISLIFLIFIFIYKIKKNIFNNY